MKSSICSILLILICPVVTTVAQVSPEVLEDGRVTFRVEAPNATEVSVSGQWSGEALVLEKVNEKLWEGTTSQTVQPGVHEYGINVDGMRTIDSRNSLIKPQRWPKTSILHIPDNPPAHWDLQDIPHGTVHYHDYYSKTLKAWRKLVVYTPPVTRKARKALPVLYLSHGFSDNQDSWTINGKAHWILDSLIHDGLAEPMIIVMPDAHPIDPVDRGSGDYMTRNTQAFAKELVEDVVPFIEVNYKVIQKPSGRAFAGLSMGGGHAFTVAIQCHDLFSRIGAFSAATPKVEELKDRADVKQMNKDLKLFWVACGDKDFLFDRNQVTDAAMTEMDINHEYVITPGDNHSWPVWRRYLVEFLPMVF